MHFLQSRFVGFLTIALGLLLVFTSPPGLAAKSVHQWQFLMAHKPDNPDNVKLIQDFVDAVRERTNNQLIIKPVMPDDVPDIIGGHTSPHRAGLIAIHSDELEMGQIAVKNFIRVSPDLDVLETPMLFESHDHAARALDSNTAEELRLAALKGSNGKIRGLAFTYSGGFRNFFSNQKLSSLDDLKDMKTGFVFSRMSLDVFDQLGMDVSKFNVGQKEWFDELRNGRIAVESEDIRTVSMFRAFPELKKHVKSVLQTGHNLYLTMLTVNGPAFNSLTTEQQTVLEEEARKLAHRERELSIRQAEEAQVLFKKLGIQVVSLSEADKDKLRDIAKIVQAKYTGQHGKWVTALSDKHIKPTYAKSPQTISMDLTQ